MRVVTGEVASSAILAFGYTEIALTALMLKLLKQGQTMVDVGSHFGYEALLACQLIGPQGRVICFEPSPSTFAFTQKNLSRLPQAELHQLGVGDQPTTLWLENRPIWQSAFNRFTDKRGQVGSVAVSVTTLDQALADRAQKIDFIKCDAEGFELAILKGAHHILFEDAPLVVLEADMPTSEGKSSPRAYQLADYMGRYGYQAFNFDFDGNLRVGPLNSFPVHHANIAFVPKARLDLLSN